MLVVHPSHTAVPARAQDRIHPSLAGGGCDASATVLAEAERTSYEAFCSRQQAVYLRYAAVRLGDPAEAQEVVEAVLHGLAAAWPLALRDPSPAATAWDRFTRVVSVRVGGCQSLHGALPPAQADALMLRYRVGLSPGRAAEVTGRLEEEFTALLHSALRQITDSAHYLWHIPTR
ncbi:hypothetical protein [Streptomyces lavendofoliae]|uniref:hypothetical protein n=1 Tax=Streptomyces lavendofoliae TaxID=67314 RepID=UPI003D8E1594